MRSEADRDLHRALRWVFPDLPPFRSVRTIGEGFSSRVVEVDGEIVFRIAKTARAAKAQALQARFLPTLSASVPLPVPRPAWYSSPDAGFRFGALGYPKLAGGPLQKHRTSSSSLPRLADALGKFLVALHAFPVERAVALGVPWRDARREADATKEAILSILRQRLTNDEFFRVQEWWHGFRRDSVLALYEPRLIHGDLWYENLLVDGATHALSGVLDFDEVGLGDVAEDFAMLRYLGDGFAAAVLAAYLRHGGDPGPQIEHRIQRLWEYREFPILPHLAAIQDLEEIDDAIRKIRAGPVLTSPEGEFRSSDGASDPRSPPSSPGARGFPAWWPWRGAA